MTEKWKNFQSNGANQIIKKKKEMKKKKKSKSWKSQKKNAAGVTAQRGGRMWKGWQRWRIFGMRVRNFRISNVTILEFLACECEWNFPFQASNFNKNPNVEVRRDGVGMENERYIIWDIHVDTDWRTTERTHHTHTHAQCAVGSWNTFSALSVCAEAAVHTRVVAAQTIHQSTA